MPMSIPARKKKLGNGTLLDAWKQLKAKNKALATPAYKPDITPFLAKYDQDLALFDKFQTHKDDMEPLGNDKQIEPLAMKIGGHYEELKKLASQWETHIKNTSSTASRDLEDVLTDQFEFTENEI